MRMHSDRSGSFRTGPDRSGSIRTNPDRSGPIWTARGSFGTGPDAFRIDHRSCVSSRLRVDRSLINVITSRNPFRTDMDSYRPIRTHSGPIPDPYENPFRTADRSVKIWFRLRRTNNRESSSVSSNLRRPAARELNLEIWDRHGSIWIHSDRSGPIWTAPDRG